MLQANKKKGQLSAIKLTPWQGPQKGQIHCGSILCNLNWHICKRQIPCLQANIHKIWEGNTYSGNRDSIPTPATCLLILNVLLSPALRLAITIPFIIETRLLFSGTSCYIRHNSKQKTILLSWTKNQAKHKHEWIFNNKLPYHFELHNIPGLYIRYLSLPFHLLHSFLV